MLGDTDLSGTVMRRPEGGWRADLQGASLDATALAATLDKPGPTKQDEPPLVFDGKFDRIILGPKREARNVVLQLYSDGTHWQSVRVDAAPFGAGALKLRFGESWRRAASSLSRRAISALRCGFSTSPTILPAARSRRPARREDAGPVRTFSGQIDGSDYQLVSAPVMAKLLSLASLSGIGSLLGRRGHPVLAAQRRFLARRTARSR